MLGQFDALRIVSDKLGQRHTVRVQDVDVCRRDVKIETYRRLICAIDIIWSQSQLGHPKELIVQNQGSNCEKSFQEICLRPPPPNVFTEFNFGAVFMSN